MHNTQATPEKTQILFTLSIGVTKYKDGTPAIELRKIIKDKMLIKQICSRALAGETISAEIEIRDKVKAVSRLKEVGLI